MIRPAARNHEVTDCVLEANIEQIAVTVAELSELGAPARL